MIRRLHWARGLRAGIAVVSAMVVCRLLGRPMGWAALGGFEAVLVDNGGPYQSRVKTIAAVLFGGAACGLLGSMIPPASAAIPWMLVSVAVTAAVCFAVTFARVVSQPIANTSVIILVLYFAGFGSSDRTWAGAIANVLAYVLGGLWAATFSLVLWPVDPFRPARQEVSGCYDLLAAFTSSLQTQEHGGHDDDHASAMDAKRQIRAKLESARVALAGTPARAPVRTVRARNLSVLLETADMLFAATVRLTELAENAGDRLGVAALEDVAGWLANAERTIAGALRNRPEDGTESFGPNGSNRMQHIGRRVQARSAHAGWRAERDSDAMRLLLGEERDALQNVEIAFDAVQAVWTGVDFGAGRIRRLELVRRQPLAPAWRDAIAENWALDSRMMRHALRIAAVGATDVLLMRTVHVSHGFWLAMTSIIVLQPYSAGTLRKGLERVGGTIAGGFLAAGLAAVIHTYTGTIAVITACAVLTLATYAVDYGWYSFFLTPTFVLMSLPYLRDWRYAGVRIFTTMLGAATAVVAMRLLWPQSLRVELSGLFARCAEAVEAYLRAVLRYWDLPSQRRNRADRDLLAPARRACGLSSQEAEEALDRALLEPLPTALNVGLPRAALTGDAREFAANESALAFTTYIRRFTQCVTTLAAAGQPDESTRQRMIVLMNRMSEVSARLRGAGSGQGMEHPVLDSHKGETAPDNSPEESLSEQMLSRMERQTGVLSRAAASIVTEVYGVARETKDTEFGRVPR